MISVWESLCLILSLPDVFLQNDEMFIFKAKSWFRTQPVFHVFVFMLHLFYISLNFIWWSRDDSVDWGRGYYSLAMSAVQNIYFFLLSSLDCVLKYQNNNAL